MATSGDAELLLIPRVDYDEMRRTANRMSDALERATEQSSMAMQRDLRRGVSRGINQGIDDGNKGFSKLKLGLAAIAASAGAVITDSLNKTFGGVDEQISKIAEKADKIRAIGNQSNAFGIDKGTYASMTVTGKALGLEDDDLKGAIEGWLESLASDSSLVNYRNISDDKGVDEALLRMLYTASTKNEKEAHGWLASEGTFGSDATFLMPIVAEIKKLAENGESITWDNLNKGVGIGVTSKQYSEALGLSEGNSKGIALADAKLESNAILSPVTKNQQQAYSSAVQNIAALEREKMATVSERVEMQKQMMKLERLQMEYTRKAVEALIKTYNELLKVGEFIDVGGRVDGAKNGIADFVEDPSLKTAGGYVKGVAGITPLGLMHGMYKYLEQIANKKESPMDLNNKAIATQNEHVYKG